MNRFECMFRNTFCHAVVMPTLLLLLALPALAVDDRAPEQIIQETSAQVLTVLNEEYEQLSNDPDLIRELIDTTLVPVVDLDSMGKLILGKHWKLAGEEQRAAFVLGFKDMLIRIFGKTLLDYGKAELTVLPNQPEQQGKYRIVQTELDIGAGQPPLQVAYVFRRNKQKEWKIFDFSVDGLSLVKNFRTSFSQEIQETSLQALIDRLETTDESDLPEGVRIPAE
ncbi:MAG: ABC transporter substrate-binding protein [Proteobacteria bacterium]|nr:ABC transporter substrate-binding protein [Pseudomonadota bacterium]